MKPFILLTCILHTSALAPSFTHAQRDSVSITLSPQSDEVQMAKEPEYQVSNSLHIQHLAVKSLFRRLKGSNRKFLDVRPDIQEERVSAFFKDRSTALVTRDVANLLGGIWIPLPNAKHPEGYSFQYYYRAKSIRDALRAKVKTVAIAPYRKLTEYLKTSPEAFRKLEAELRQQNKKPDDPILRNGNLFYLHYAPCRTAITLLSTLSDEQLFEGIENQRLFLPTHSMNEMQLRLVLQLAQYASRGMEATPEEDMNGLQGRRNEVIQFAREFGIFLYFPLDPLRACVLNCGFGFGGMQVAGANMGEERDMSLDILPVRGNPYTHSATQPPPQYPELESLPFPESVDTTKWKEATWNEVLAQLSEHLDIPIYSDSYSYLLTPHDRGDLPMPNLTKKSLPEALDALCTRYHYLWWYQDGALLFRSRTWFLECLYEVPQTTLTLLEKQLKTTETLDATAVTALAELTPRQIEGLGAIAASVKGDLKLATTNRVAYRRLRQAGSAYSASRYLSVFKLLSDEQKRAAMSAGGLSLDRLTQKQRVALQFVLMEQTASEVGYQPKGAFFRINISPLTGISNTTERGEDSSAKLGIRGVSLTMAALERTHLALYATLNIAIKSNAPPPQRRTTQKP